MLAGLEVSVSRSFWFSHGHIRTFSKLVTQSLCPCTCSTANLSVHRVLILQVVSSNHVSYAYVYYIKESVCFFCRFHKRRVSAAGFRSHTDLAAEITSEENVSLHIYTQLQPRNPDQALHCRYLKRRSHPYLRCF